MNIDALRDNTIACRRQTPVDRACLVGISGIDASGKGFVSGQVASQLEAAGQRVALINVDAWLNLPHVRFSKSDAGEHFYHYAVRSDEMFDKLVLPLKRSRSANLTMDLAEESANEFRPHTYVFDNIDTILLEGIFIFKKAYTQQFDLKIWIDCSFETAIERAIARGQENLSRAATVAAYQNIYFPAQRLHFQLDEPKEAADLLFLND